MKTLTCLFFIFLLAGPSPALALISEGRPGVPYFDHVLFLQSKVVKGDRVVAASLAFADPHTETDLCRNSVDVFGGLEKFREIPARSWVMVDYELQSIAIGDGFVGDADIRRVIPCPDVETCLEWRNQRQADATLRTLQATEPRAEATSTSRVEDVQERLEIGRQLAKNARCRGCHRIEGFGADHAPSLTWKRFKYEKGWLPAYLQSPYRMRPAMDDLMMLDYTSSNAEPSLQPSEVALVANYLTNVATAAAPNDRFRYEPWQDYDCFGCHTRLYRETPLEFRPTHLPEPLARLAKGNATLQTCLGCHPLGDLRTIQPGQAETPNRLATDLLLAFEKLTLSYLAAFLENPAYLEPQTGMPNLGLSRDRIEEIRGFAREVKQAIQDGGLKPRHTPYRIEKRNSFPSGN